MNKYNIQIIGVLLIHDKVPRLSVRMPVTSVYNALEVPQEGGGGPV